MQIYMRGRWLGEEGDACDATMLAKSYGPLKPNCKLFTQNKEKVLRVAKESAVASGSVAHVLSVRRLYVGCMSGTKLELQDSMHLCLFLHRRRKPSGVGVGGII